MHLARKLVKRSARTFCQEGSSAAILKQSFWNAFSAPRSITRQAASASACREGPGHIQPDNHIVVAEMLQNPSAHLSSRGPHAAVVDNFGRDGGFVLGITVKDDENAPKAVGE